MRQKIKQKEGYMTRFVLAFSLFLSLHTFAATAHKIEANVDLPENMTANFLNYSEVIDHTASGHIHETIEMSFLPYFSISIQCERTADQITIILAEGKFTITQETGGIVSNSLLPVAYRPSTNKYLDLRLIDDTDGFLRIPCTIYILPTGEIIFNHLVGSRSVWEVGLYSWGQESATYTGKPL